MSRGLMLVIGLIFFGVAVASLFERKWLLATIALCYGVANICLAYLESPPAVCEP